MNHTFCIAFHCFLLVKDRREKSEPNCVDDAPVHGGGARARVRARPPPVREHYQHNWDSFSAALGSLMARPARAAGPKYSS